MSARAIDAIACPVCGSELSLAQIFANEETQLAFARLAAVSLPLGARVMNYVTLFAPPKTRLTIGKQVKLILQLLPDLERKAITHKGREWSAPLTAWAAAIDQMMAARAAGRLELPMTGHGYLYAIVAGQADKLEAQDEREREQQLRTGAGTAARQDTVTVRSGAALPIGEALAVTFGGKDEALAKIDADARNAAPMPDSVRERIEALRGKKAEGGAT